MSFSFLGDAATPIDELALSKLFTVGHEDFEQNGCLCSVFKIMGATLIMSFNRMKSKYGTHNPVVTRILQSSHMECKLGVTLLENWSIVNRKISMIFPLVSYCSCVNNPSSS